MSSIEIQNLSANYGPIIAVDNLTMSVPSGTVVSLLGANGSGKTSTLRCVSGLMKRQGSITIAGKRVDSLPPEAIVHFGVAHVPEGRGLFGQLTVAENLKMGCYVRGDKAGIAADLERVYRYFPRLGERKKQPAATLSGGEQQMLAIARALMLDPKVLLLDEPSLGLAPLIIKEIFEIVRDINQKDGVTVLLVEQNATTALKISQTAYVLETGRIVASGPADELARDESIRKSYLGY